MERLHNAILGVLQDDMNMIGEPVASTHELIEAFNQYATLLGEQWAVIDIPEPDVLEEEED